MTNSRDLGIEERYTPPVELLPDGWEKADDGLYHKLETDEERFGKHPYCRWELVYNGYRITIEDGLTAQSYHTVEKDPFDRLWTGVKLAHLPEQYIYGDE